MVLESCDLVSGSGVWTEAASQRATKDSIGKGELAEHSEGCRGSQRGLRMERLCVGIRRVHCSRACFLEVTG